MARETGARSHWAPAPERPARGTRGRAYAERRTAPNRITPESTSLSDESLLARLCRGDTAAGQALAARHYTALLRYLQRIAGTEAAEDLHQQTWLSALAHADRFVAGAGAGTFKGWLYRIATNKTKDHWRSARRERAAKAGFGRMTEGECSPWAGHAADGAEQHDRLRSALQRLPDPQREVLLLRYYSDMKFADIADVLGCPLNTALTRAHKALIKLRGAMDAETQRPARAPAQDPGREPASAAPPR
jgi:RNA polymerase sigma-70 factor (ECF subfamily)